jgi:hypothetical protein
VGVRGQHPYGTVRVYGGILGIPYNSVRNPYSSIRSSYASVHVGFLGFSYIYIYIYLIDVNLDSITIRIIAASLWT